MRREAEHLSRINIQEDTKGGRSGASAPRWVVANDEVKGIHELRAAYACERYEQLTGQATTVNDGHCYRIDRNLDRQPRQQISVELGHNRIDVV